MIAALAACLYGATGTALADPARAAARPVTAMVAVGQPGSLAVEARRELAAARETRYQHTTDVDEQSGRFDYDCSGFVDYALARVNPAAYRALPVSRTRPLAEDIVEAIQGGAAAPGGPWQDVATPAELRPGDLVSWLTPQDSDSDNTGHVMIVLAAPTLGPRAGEWLIQVADSTTSPHAQDARIADSPDGLGTGTIGLVTDTAGHPVAYYWRGGVSTQLRHTVIALGRPD